ncbi:hypothetical protein ACJIZ3_006050 [Penstemon smallii]|uniref:HMA domain-containing protein n=1 Tax=Penstemon smallii TaxID=265156 RepID=A0ABD3S6L5_9LAMI
MNPEMEKPRVTEIKVRMDCNGCVQKIKKALHGITGIYDIYVDFPEQKITVIGCADPEKIIKALKKTRKTAIICLHEEQSDPPTEPPPEGGEPPSESTNQPAEPPQSEAEPPMDQSKEPPRQENPPPEMNMPPESVQFTQPPKPENVEEVHVIYHHPPDYRYRYAYNHNLQQGYSGQSSGYPGEPAQPTQYYGQQGYGGQSSAYLGGLGVRGEPVQPPQPNSSTYPNGQAFRGESVRPPQPYSSTYLEGQGFRWEPVQPPQPYGRYSQGFKGEPVQPPQSYGTYPSGPSFRGEPVQPPQPHGHNHQQGYEGQSSGYPSGPGFRGESAQPVYVSHNYNTYKPSPYVTEYAYSRPPPSYYAPRSPPNYYAYPRSPPSNYSHYSRPDNFNQDYYSGNHGNGNITSMFSEENPNACKIM